MQGNSEAENIPVKKKKKLIRPDLKPLTARQLLNSQNINRYLILSSKFII